MLKNKARLCVLAVFISVTGCTLIRYSSELMTLKSVGDSQKDIQQYLAAQEKKFSALQADVKANRLQSGVSKQDIVNVYGDPVFSRPLADDLEMYEMFLYRHPTQYFTSDRIYLYFDKDQKLTRWQYEPAEKKK